MSSLQYFCTDFYHKFTGSQSLGHGNYSVSLRVNSKSSPESGTVNDRSIFADVGHVLVSHVVAALNGTMLRIFAHNATGF